MSSKRGRTLFLCQQCGNESPKWLGRCPGCNQWNSYVEVQLDSSSRSHRRTVGTAAEPQELVSLETAVNGRLSLPFPEFNRVLGGGLVKGSLVLLAGEPGIGKSTLLLQCAAGLAAPASQVLYVSGEESAHQIHLRAQRLGIEGRGIYLLAETAVEAVLHHLERLSPALVVVDSIQTLYADDLSSGAGSVVQVRECTRLLAQWAKAQEVPLLMAGHVTKDGTVAGPRVLEHMVDVVLYLEGDPSGPFRILRGSKNRFGATNDIAVFQMSGGGLEEVGDPSRIFIGERRAGAVGSTIVVSLEGSRPLLAEVQALTTPTQFNPPRRTGNGVDFHRLILVAAVLSKRGGLPLANQDIIVNVAGGLHIGEPAVDLGIALSITSSLRNSPVDPSCICLGEVGLSGELRAVPQLDRRLTEAAKLGFSRAIIPESTTHSRAMIDGIQALPVATLREALRQIKPSPRSARPSLP